MRHVDFTPLYRSTVGFDRIFSLLDNRGVSATNLYVDRGWRIT